MNEHICILFWQFYTLCLICSLFIINVCYCVRCLHQNPGQLSWGPDGWWNNSWLYWMLLARKSSTVPLCLLSFVPSLLLCPPFFFTLLSCLPLSFLSSLFLSFCPLSPPIFSPLLPYLCSHSLQIYMQSSYCSSRIQMWNKCCDRLKLDRSPYPQSENWIILLEWAADTHILRGRERERASLNGIKTTFLSVYQ